MHVEFPIQRHRLSKRLRPTHRSTECFTSPIFTITLLNVYLQEFLLPTNAFFFSNNFCPHVFAGLHTPRSENGSSIWGSLPCQKSLLWGKQLRLPCETMPQNRFNVCNTQGGWLQFTQGFWLVFLVTEIYSFNTHHSRDSALVWYFCNPLFLKCFPSKLCGSIHLAVR